MSNVIDKKMRKAEIISGLTSGLALTAVLLVLSKVTGSLLFNTRLISLLAVSVLFVMGGFREGVRSKLTAAAFSAIAASVVFSIFDDVSLIIRSDPDELHSIMRSLVTGLIHSAFLTAAAVMCVLVYSGSIGLICRRRLMLFMYLFIISCILPFVFDIGYIAVDATTLQALCFAPENKDAEPVPGKLGRISITLFPFISALAACLTFGSSIVFALEPLPGSGEYTASHMAGYEILFYAGPTLMLISVMLFPLVLFSKRFASDGVSSPERTQT